MGPRRTPHRRRRGRTAVVIAATAAVGVAGGSVLFWPASTARPSLLSASHHSSIRSLMVSWPAQGQAAVSISGVGHRASGPPRPVPIASVAKVMTAYVVLHTFPLRSADDPGFTMTMSESQALEAARDDASGQSFVPVEAGEVLTERQALEALLLPSANNIAMALAEQFPGGEPAFVRAMNDAATTLHMTHTTYTDPSGLDPSTVSTAIDQVRLARAAMRDATFAAIVAMPSAEIPVAGLIANTDTLVGHDGFVGIKTGSDDAAGGCFLFEDLRRIDGRQRTIIGVVLGQHDGPLINAALGAAQDLVAGITRRPV